MTRQEWIDEADRLDGKSREAYESDDEITGEWYEKKAEACRYNACNGTVD